MYGIVNRSMQEMIVTQFGDAEWAEIKKRCDVDVEYFLSTEPYDDALTYKLLSAASEVLGISIGQILNSFGEFWILNTAKLKYGGFLNAGGPNFKAFLLNLPLFHNRIMLMYPKLTPPEFKVEMADEHSLLVHYYSKREGLQEVVRGLLFGWAKLFETETEIQLIQSRTDGASHQIFKVMC